jgi:hypothetical protein
MFLQVLFVLLLVCFQLFTDSFFFVPQQPLHLRNRWAPRELSYSGVLREMKNKWILFFKENFVARKSVQVLIIIKLIRLGECFAFQDFQV